MSRNKSRIRNNPSAFAVSYDGDIAEAHKWLGYAKLKLKFMLANHAGAVSSTFIPDSGVEIQVYTRPNRIRIKAGGNVMVCLGNPLSGAGNYPDGNLPPYNAFKTTWLYEKYGEPSKHTQKDNFFAGDTGHWHDDDAKTAISWKNSYIYKKGRFANTGNFIDCAGLLKANLVATDQKPTEFIATFTKPNTLRFYTYADDLAQPDRLVLLLKKTIVITSLGTLLNNSASFVEFTGDGQNLMYCRSLTSTVSSIGRVDFNVAAGTASHVVLKTANWGAIEYFGTTTATYTPQSPYPPNFGGPWGVETVESSTSGSGVSGEPRISLAMGKPYRKQYFYIYAKVTNASLSSSSSSTATSVVTTGINTNKTSSANSDRTTSWEYDLKMGVLDYMTGVDNPDYLTIDSGSGHTSAVGSASIINNTANNFTENLVSFRTSFTISLFSPKKSIVIYSKSTLNIENDTIQTITSGTYTNTNTGNSDYYVFMNGASQFLLHNSDSSSSSTTSDDGPGAATVVLSGFPVGTTTGVNNDFVTVLGSGVGGLFDQFGTENTKVFVHQLAHENNTLRSRLFFNLSSTPTKLLIEPLTNTEFLTSFLSITET